ncbi:MAG: hypothetical protein HGA97_09130 [Chlorobiaceae bacterium]|nr:hypothetical protein [Chlorobiaceae bacterium]
MTQTPEPAKKEIQPKTPPGGAPKPKPAAAAKASGTPPVASAPKPKPAVAAKPSGASPGSGPRLAPLAIEMRAGSPSGGAKVAPDDGSLRSKPVAKKRLCNIFPGGSPKL